MNLKINTEKLIEEYNNGASMNTIAKIFGTYPTTVKRILEKNNIELRHDSVKKGDLLIKDGEKLIEWAKAQGRLVTKTELAEVIGRKRLSPSYFLKYPELGQYIVTHEQNDLQEYSQKLYSWLQKNNIQYKPNDRTKIKMAVTALLLEEYSNIILQLNIKPKCVSAIRFERDNEERFYRADKAGASVVWLKEENFENLDSIKIILEELKK